MGKLARFAELIGMNKELTIAVESTILPAGILPLAIIRNLEDPDKNGEVAEMIRGIFTRNTASPESEDDDRKYYRRVQKGVRKALKSAGIEIDVPQSE